MLSDFAAGLANYQPLSIIAFMLSASAGLAAAVVALLGYVRTQRKALFDQLLPGFEKLRSDGWSFEAAEAVAEACRSDAWLVLRDRSSCCHSCGLSPNCHARRDREISASFSSLASSFPAASHCCRGHRRSNDPSSWCRYIGWGPTPRASSVEALSAWWLAGKGSFEIPSADLADEARQVLRQALAGQIGLKLGLSQLEGYLKGFCSYLKNLEFVATSQDGRPAPILAPHLKSPFTVLEIGRDGPQPPPPALTAAASGTSGGADTEPEEEEPTGPGGP